MSRIVAVDICGVGWFCGGFGLACGRRRPTRDAKFGLSSGVVRVVGCLPGRFEYKAELTGLQNLQGCRK